MTTTWMASVLAGSALICSAHPPVVQDEGKAEATELASESQAALKQLYARRAAGEGTWPEGACDSGVPQGHESRPRDRRAVWRRRPVEGGKAVAYYKTTGASVGLQVGGQRYGYAMLFMNAKALEQLDNANGFEVGVGPSVVLVDEGMAKTTTTTTMKDDIYAFVFGQKGLMAGLGIQGNKIKRSRPSRLT